jgi:hypothetical protein
MRICGSHSTILVWVWCVSTIQRWCSVLLFWMLFHLQRATLVLCSVAQGTQVLCFVTGESILQRCGYVPTEVVCSAPWLFMEICNTGEAQSCATPLSSPKLMRLPVFRHNLSQPLFSGVWMGEKHTGHNIWRNVFSVDRPVPASKLLLFWEMSLFK